MLRLSQDAEQRLIRRLRRIQGQARGVERMIQEGRDCEEVLEQLAALRAAAHHALLFATRAYLQACADQDPVRSARAVGTLLETLGRLS
ncbi:metal-sensing transcriptional repressor [Thermoflexus sp.]|uniref:metal-sensing transcriptional repressor n=1 Tax=Thermoflexus sp. TaxID=1969742 RepID=UPI0017527C44|nr:metal-sensing transcriptional repressor [Thermoflexus sp.]